MKVWSIGIFLILFSVSSYGQDSLEIKFIWEATTLGSRTFEHASMRVPVTFGPDPTTYYLQFDTGAAHSYLYSNRFKTFDYTEGWMETSIGRIKFIENSSMPKSKDENAPIGTIGADFLKGKIVQINFPDQTIKIGFSYNPNAYDMTPLVLLDGRPVVPINIKGDEHGLLFDTGSSLFGIWTTKRNWNKLRDKSATVVSFPISSWGKINEGFCSRVDTVAPLFLGSLSALSDIQVWYVDNKKFKRFFRRNDLYGILGNQAFRNKEILLDFKHNMFGIKKGTSPAMFLKNEK